MPRQLLMAIAVSTFLALMLSMVPSALWRQADVPTFQTSHPVQLSERNVLDLFTLTPTHYKMKRIKWENPSVYVDLIVKPGEKVDESQVYRDFYGLTYGLLTHTDNVGQVYFRLLEESEQPKESRLLVAIQTTGANLKSFSKPAAEIPDVDSFVKNTFPVRIDPYFYERISP
ncbi:MULTISPECIES: hypothetical protein [Brevibacillus]|uniref:hypothetical protein n=1 Tax=Brevibacillus TaxID=55080 RepID=UPI000EBA085C|nr:hypothetical protein [Brevibacillus sp.]HBZ83982.1 hypothetical protein [Brevibacillus sp.]